MRPGFFFRAPQALRTPRAPALLVLLLALPAQAGEDVFQFFAEEATVVAAAKHPQRLSDAPANTTVITAQDIETYGYQTLAEALQSVPGFDVTSDRNYSYLWVRGFGRPSDYNSRVLTLVDGHRINENVYGSTLAGHEFSLDVRSIERIEVIKGPGSALYGDSAFFAVVNIIPKKGKDLPSPQLAAEAASYGTHREFLGVGRTRPGRWDLYVSGSYRRMDGQNLFYSEFRDTGGGIARNADREAGYTAYASLTRGSWSLHTNTSRRTKRIPTGAFETLFGDPGTETRDARSFLELKSDREIRSGLKLHTRAYYDWYSYDGDYVEARSDSQPGRMINEDASRNRWYGEELRADLEPFGSRHPLMLGQEYEKNVRGWQTNYDSDPYALYTDVDLRPERWAFFAQQELQVHRHLGVTLGLRYDHYSSFGGTLNPRTAAVCHLWEGSTLKLLYGSAFRAPSLYEMFYVAADNSTRSGLDPERVKSYEAHWEQRFAGRGSIGLGYFHNRIQGLIDQAVDADGNIGFRNTESILSRGLECESTWTLGRRFSGRLGYTYQHTEEGADVWISNSPHHTGTLGARAHFETFGTSLGAEMHFVSERLTTHGTLLPGAAFVSLHATLQPWRRGPSLQASVHNLTDAAYSVSGAAEHVQDAIPQDGRNYVFGLEYGFGGR